MSNVVDNRVVEMRFDNKQFESNVHTSMSTLEKLKQSLKLTDAAKGLDAVSNSAKRFDMSAMGYGVDTVKAKFSALEVMAVTALANITNSAVNAGKRLVSAFTIEPIKTGLQEYETQINAVQTILANTQSKGTTLQDVNAALDELNHYADKTIYNFTEMTRNIGTFTAAGIDLDTSVNAIQGIANLAAVSGSTSQQASTAMYQLSQALATGTIRLMDWNSVVNAGMGGQVFQDALKKTSEELGTGAEAAIKAQGSFRESLQTGWLTSEVLTETLKKFTTSGANEYVAEYCGINAEAVQAALDAAEAQYGEADAIDKAADALAKKTGKNKDEIASALNFAKTAEDAATKVKTFSQLLDTLKEAAQSGWTQTWEILIGDFEEAKSLWTQVSDYFGEAINNMSDARNKVLQAWADHGGRDMTIDAIKNAWNGLLSVIKPVQEAFREVFPPIGARRLVELSRSLREITSHFKLSESAAANLKATFKGIFSVIDIGITVITKLASGFVKLLGNITGIGGGILGITGTLGNWVSSVSESIKASDAFGKAIDTVVRVVQNGINNFKEFANSFKIDFDTSKFELLKTVLESVWNALKRIGQGVKDAINFDNIVNGLKVLNGTALLGILKSLKNFIDGFSESFSIDKLSFVDNVKEILGGVQGCLEEFQNKLKSEQLQKIATAIGILAASLFILSTVDPAKLAGATGAITAMFGDLVGFLALFSNLSFNPAGLVKLSAGLIGISFAILILAGAVKTMGNLDLEQLGKGLLGITVLLGELTIVAKALSSKGLFGSKMTKGVWQVVLIAAAVKILASACRDLGSLNLAELAKGLAGVGVLLTEMSVFMNLTEFGGKATSNAVAIVLIASALKILASVVSDFAGISWGGIAKGLVAIGALLTEITAFTTIAGDASNVMRTATSLILIGAAMKIFASAMSELGRLSWDQIARGLVAMGTALLGVGIAMNLMPKNLISMGAGLVIVSAALIILANALGQMGGMSWSEIAKGLVTLGGSMLILAVGLNMMSGTLGGSAALIVAAAAIAMLVPSLKSLGEMTLGEIVKSLIALAGSLVIIGVAGAVLAPVVPAILALSAALLVFGVACLAVGAGIALLGVGLTSLAAIVPAHVASILGSLVLIAEGFGAIIVALCESIVSSASAIGEALKTMVLTAIDVLVTCLPAIVEALMQLITQVLQALLEYGPQIGSMLFELVEQGFSFFMEKAPALIDGAINLVLMVINGIAARAGDIVSALVNLFSAVIQGLIDNLGPIVEQIIEPMVEIIVNAFTQILETALPIIESITILIEQLGITISEVFLSICEVISTCGETIATVLISLSDSIHTVFEGIGEVIISIGDSIKSVLDGIADVISSIGEAALNAGTGFDRLADGVKTITELKLADVAASMGAVAIGLGKIANHADGLAAAGEGMRGIAEGTNLSASAFSSISSGISSVLTKITSIGPAASASMATMTASVVTASSCFTSLSSAASAAATKVVGAMTLIRGSASTASSAMASVMSSMVSTISRAGSAISSAMTNAMRSLVNAVNSAKSSVVAAMTSLLTALITLINSRGATFQSSGLKLMTQLANGIKSGASAVKNGLSTAMSSCESSIKSHYESFKSAGKYLAEGLAAGIRAGIPAVKAAGSDLGTAADAATRASTKVKSPSRVFMETGRYLAEGLAIGITQNTYKAADASTNMANGVLSSFQNAMKIHSPSLVMQENGEYVVDGLAEGIDNNTSAEDAIEKKAANIVSAFKKELDKADLDQTTADLEKKLWDALNPEEDNESVDRQIERVNKGIETTIAKYNLQQKNVELALKEYEYTAKQLGEDAEKTQEAYNKYLQEQIDLVDLGNSITKQQKELAELQGATTMSASEAYLAYQEYLNQVWHLFEEGKITEEEARKWAASKSGVKIDENGKIIREAVEKNVETATSAVSDAVVSSLETATPEIVATGQNYATALTSGMVSSKTDISDGVMTMVNSCLEAVKSKYQEWVNVGKYLVEGFAKGVEEGIEEAKVAASKMADAVTETAKDELDINSPSRVFTKIGGYVASGFSRGIDEMRSSVKNSAQSMAQVTVESAQNALSKIQEVVDNNTDIQPTIRPVVDMDALGDGKVSLTTNLGTVINRPIDTWSSVIRDTQKDINDSNERVISAIKSLRDDMNAFYSDGDQEVALYVDSKKLATSIAKPMNRQLNILQRRGAH